MPEKSYFTLDEKENVLSVYRQLLRNSRPVLRVEDFNRMRRLISEAVETGHYQRNKQGINPVVRNLNTALILCDRVGLERSMLISVLLFNLVVRIPHYRNRKKRIRGRHSPAHSGSH